MERRSKNDGGMFRNHGAYFYAVGSDSSGKEAVACHLHVLAAVPACFFLSKPPPGILPPPLGSRDLLVPWTASTPGRLRALDLLNLPGEAQAQLLQLPWGDWKNPGQEAGTLDSPPCSATSWLCGSVHCTITPLLWQGISSSALLFCELMCPL